jgi:acetyl-CoA carboxylase carboxyltransferase component
VDDQSRQDIIDARKLAHEGSINARKVIHSICDSGSFDEYGALANSDENSDQNYYSDSLICGIASVNNKSVAIAAYDRGVHNGTQTDRNMRKLAKVIYLAQKNRWPFIIFLEGDGASRDEPLLPPPIINYTRARWDVLEGLTELSGWVPTISIITGDSHDGHAAIAFLTDLVIATKGSSIGSIDSARITSRLVEELAKRGEVDVIAEDIIDAITTCKSLLSLWHESTNEFEEPDEAATISKIVPPNRRRQYDMRKVINAFADKNSTLEVGSRWGSSMITAFAKLYGRTVGIIANQPMSARAGAIDSAAADKASRFIECCDSYGFPLVSLIDNPGYMVGPEAEAEGMARHHARPLAALHHRNVPLYSVQIRKAYGLGPYAMSGFGTSRHVPDLRLAWPSVESAGMSLEGAAYLVKRKEIKAASTPHEAREIRDLYAEEMRDASSGLNAGRTFSFDDIILPEETRPRIARHLIRTPRQIPNKKIRPIDPK